MPRSRCPNGTRKHPVTKKCESKSAKVNKNTLIKMKKCPAGKVVNTKTGKTYKDEQERDADVNDPNTGTTMEHIKQDVLVEVSPKSLEVLQRIWKAQNKDDKSKA